MQQEQLRLPVGARIRDHAGGSYIIEGTLGQGGFGAVYLVQNRRLGPHRFALKEVIQPDIHEQEQIAFEAEVLRRLNHPALPRVHQVFENQRLRRMYILMDYIEGSNLEVWRMKQPDNRFPLSQVLMLLEPIVDALNYLHHQKPPIVHLDVKPANIIIPTGGNRTGAVLVDFGIAKEYVEEKTTSVIRHGSPGYAAPEQYRSGTSPRTDIYGLGATLYTLLSGIVPIDAITRAMASYGYDPLDPIHLMARSVPAPISIAVEQAMQINPSRRFDTVEQFWKEIITHSVEHPAQDIRSEPPDTPLPLLWPETQQRAEVAKLPTNLISPNETDSAQPSGGRGISRFWQLLVISLVCIIIVCSAFFASISIRDSAKQAGGVAVSAPSAVATPTIAPSPTATPSPDLGIYPALVSSYSGTIATLNGEHTNLYLMQIQQTQGNVRGFFRGLGVAGPFTGTVTPSLKLHFIVTINSAQLSSIAIDGDIKLGGDLVGSFKAFDKNGQPAGMTGTWQAQESKAQAPYTQLLAMLSAPGWESNLRRT